MFFICLCTVVLLLHSVESVRVSHIGTSAAPGEPPKWKEKFNITWGTDHVFAGPKGELLMVLDKVSGTGFRSYDRYVHGYISANIKLVPKDSAGVATTFYMHSDTENVPDHHDELDFEFLGNRNGQPYVLHTNIFINGVGDREIQYHLWFDPTQDYHTYSLLFNSHQIVFFVDKVPIRILRNSTFVFPSQPMYIHASIWNASGWATRGGLDKVDWSHAPFIAGYSDYVLDSCSYDEQSRCNSTKWWDQPKAWTLSPEQQKSYMWLQKSSNLSVYNYCNDTKRFPTPPPECSISPW